MKVAESDCFLATSIGRNSLQDRFMASYLRHQQQFSHTEIGDQIDMSQEAINSALSESGTRNSNISPNLLAKRINDCLVNRYMGVCAASDCETRQLVGVFIESSVQISTLST